MIFRCFCNTLQAASNVYTVRYSDDFYWTIHFIKDLYKSQISSTSRNRLVYFQNFAIFTEYFFIATIATFFLATFTFCLYPIYLYLGQGELAPIIPLYLPGIDETTASGFATLTIYHFTICVIAVIGFPSIEFFTSITIISSLIFGKLISSDLHQINNELNEFDSEMLTVVGRLRNVLLMHQEMGEYVNWLFP